MTSIGWRALAVGLGATCAAACGHEGKKAPPTTPAIRASAGKSPFTAGCNGASKPGTNFSNTVVEPFLAIDPTNHLHLVGVWQQDRFSNGGSNGLLTGVSLDGGRTWASAAAPFSRCTGGSPANNGDYERASDPWVTIAPDGTAYQVALAFGEHDYGKAILVSRSSDGGHTWGPATVLQRDTDAFYALDKEAVTADPKDSKFVYAVWDRLDHQDVNNSPLARGPAWFSRTTDGGATWEKARFIYDPGDDAQTIGNQIVVLPDGTLINAFTWITDNSKASVRNRIAVIRSSDRGTTWTGPFAVADVDFIGISDPRTGKPVRSGAVLPSVAVDASSGTLAMVWEDARFSGGARDGIALSKSTDGGFNWSAPTQVNQVPAAQAFNSAISIADGGKLGVLYYDFRSDDPGGPGSQLLTSVWLATSLDGGATWREVAIGGPFDLTLAPNAGGYFVGDYQGLVHDGAGFVPFFVMTDGNATVASDVFTQTAIP